MRRHGQVLLICACLIARGVWAQTGAGSIQGTVKDSSGAVIPDAKVAAEQIETGNSFNTQSNAAVFESRRNECPE